MTLETAAPWGRSIGRLAIVGGLVVVSMVVTLGALSITFLEDQASAVRELVDAAALHRDLDRTLQLLVDGETAERGYLLTGDPEFLVPLERVHDELPATLDTLGAILTEKRSAEFASSFRHAVDSRVEFTEGVVALARAGDRDGAAARVATREGMRRMDPIREIVADAGDREDDAVERSLIRVESSRARAQAAFLALLLLATLVVIGLGVSVRQNLARAELAAHVSRESEVRFRRLAEGSLDLIQISSVQGGVEYVSPSSRALLGREPEEIEAMPLEELIHEDDRSAFREALGRALATGIAQGPFTQRLRKKDGTIRTFSSRIEVVEGADGRVERFHTVQRDVTDALRETERLSDLAARDELTQLMNRRAFAEHGRALLDRCRVDGKRALLAFCDVDGLKTINDALGHEAGDALITDAAALLRETARGSDLLARLGGDEFVVLGVGGDPQSGEAFAVRLRERIVLRNERGDRPFRISVTVGSALFEPASNASLDDLVAEADAAMYQQKSRRGGATTRSGEAFVRPAALK